MIVKIFNPALIINGALTANSSGGADLSLIRENIIFVAIFFITSIIISYPIGIIFGKGENNGNVYQLMTIFTNVGFMGIPVISSIYGEKCVIYITFYILGYNLCLYTVGTVLAQKSLPKEERKLGLSGIINIGTVCSVIAIIIFFSGMQFNDSVLSFFNYVGNATIPLSMIVIGVSVARVPLKEVFQGTKVYLYTLMTSLVIPITMTFAYRWLKNDTTIFGVFILMFAMPVGSIVTMLIKENGGDEGLCSRLTIITTLLSIITIPIVTIFI